MLDVVEWLATGGGAPALQLDGSSLRIGSGAASGTRETLNAQASTDAGVGFALPP
jgi:hypothetical protein